MGTSCKFTVHQRPSDCPCLEQPVSSVPARRTLTFEKLSDAAYRLSCRTTRYSSRHVVICPAASQRRYRSTSSYFVIRVSRGSVFELPERSTSPSRNSALIMKGVHLQVRAWSFSEAEITIVDGTVPTSEMRLEDSIVILIRRPLVEI